MKVGILGPHGSGKTSLINALGKALADEGKEVAVLWEAARLCPHELNLDGTEEGQAWIFAKQLMMEAEALGFDVVLVDRTPLDQLAYIFALVRRGKASNEFGQLYFHLAYGWMSTYDLLIYVPAEFPPEDDGVRDTDPAYQKEIDASIRTLIEVMEASVVTVGGPLKARVAQAAQAVATALVWEEADARP
jgi:nicotinamide riboside kinase